MMVVVVCVCVSSMQSFRNPGSQRLSHLQSLTFKVTMGINIQRAKAGLRRERRGFPMEGFSGTNLISLPFKFHWPILASWTLLSAEVTEEQGLNMCQGRERASFDDHSVVFANISRNIDSV